MEPAKSYSLIVKYLPDKDCYLVTIVGVGPGNELASSERLYGNLNTLLGFIRDFYSKNEIQH
jgi:hypothetical protein